MGVRLADLLEECFTQGLTPEDMLYTEGEVAPFGAALLGSLGKIFRRYRDALIESDLTTPGFDAFVVASALEEGTAGDDLPPLPDFLAGRAILLAGFGMLTGTENTLFRYLWRHGAQVFLHVDPALAENGQGHWACTEQSNWIADWKADTVLACPSPGKKPKIHYFAGYDLHSQLDALRGDLIELERKDRLAVALKARSTTQQLSLLPSSENGTACPPSRNVDQRECRQQGFDNVEGLEGRRDGRGREREALPPVGSPQHPPPSPPRSSTSRWPSRTAGLCCPCCTTCPARTATFRSATRLNARFCSACWKRCSTPATAASPTARPTGRRLRISSATRTCACLRSTAFPCATFSRTWKTRLRNGSRHADAHAVAEGAADDFFAASSLPNVAAAMPAIRELINRILRDTVDTWARAHTLGGLADALSGLCDTLLVYGSGNDESGAGNGKADIWSRFPIDAECLFRLMQRVIPALKDNGMADTPLPWPLMQAMLLELVRAERVPFEADPLTGLQVLGMLETRLLRFSRVFLVDVTDDRLPGAPIRSPLLPDSLRALLGLPDTRNREQLAAYTFHRLIAGADEVWLYWQEGVETSGLFDGKKQRSRLVEELIWQEEQARGQRLKPGREPLRTAALDVRPPVRVRKVVPKTPAIREQIAASLKHPLSATRLDAYLTCPLRYYYERLCAIAPIDEVNEDDDPAAVGVLLHNVLRDFYAPAVGKTVRRDAQSGDPSCRSSTKKPCAPCSARPSTPRGWRPPCRRRARPCFPSPGRSVWACSCAPSRNRRKCFPWKRNTMPKSGGGPRQAAYRQSRPCGLA